MVTDNFSTFQGNNSIFLFWKAQFKNICPLHADYVEGGIWVLSKSKLLKIFQTSFLGRNVTDVKQF